MSLATALAVAAPAGALSLGPGRIVALEFSVLGPPFACGTVQGAPRDCSDRGEPDTLSLGLGLVDILSPFVEMNAVLLDLQAVTRTLSRGRLMGVYHAAVGAGRLGGPLADALLGVNTLTTFGTSTGGIALSTSHVWQTADSLSDPFGIDPTVIDFASIRDGSIEGLLLIGVAKGEVQLNAATIGLDLGIATSATGQIPLDGNPLPAFSLGTPFQAPVGSTPGGSALRLAAVPEPSVAALLAAAALARAGLRRRRA